MNRVTNTISLGLNTLRNYYLPKKFYHSTLPLELKKELWNHLCVETRESILKHHPYNKGWRLYRFLSNAWVTGIYLLVGITPSIFYFIKDKHIAWLVFILCLGCSITSLLNSNNNILFSCVNLFINWDDNDYIDFDNKLYNIKLDKDKHNFTRVCF